MIKYLLTYPFRTLDEDVDYIDLVLKSYKLLIT